MTAKIFTYPLVIQEVYLDTFGHMNNATYLTLFEEARWDFLNKTGYGLQKIKETGLGPTILELKVNFFKELRAREAIVIETQIASYEKRVGKMLQKMLRGDEVCCTAEFVFGLFDLKARKLVLPTPEWLQAVSTTLSSS